MAAPLSFAMWVALSAAAPQALVISYQAIGIEQTDVDRLAEAMREKVGGHGWVAVDAATTATQAKAAAVCSEDVPCLSAIGTRVGAKWVVAFLMAKVGKGALITTLLIDTTTGQQRSSSSEKVVTMPEDMGNLADTLLLPLFKDVPAQVVLVPGTAGAVAATAPRPLRSVGAGVLVAGGVAGISGVVLSVAAGLHYQDLKSLNAERRLTEDSAQRGLNVSADVVVSVAIAALASGVVLLIADAASAPKSAESAKGAP